MTGRAKSEGSQDRPSESTYNIYIRLEKPQKRDFFSDPVTERMGGVMVTHKLEGGGGLK